MFIASDSHYQIGKTHLTCQDYACHSFDPVPYVIVADGCSSSPHSDIGARLLALTASRMIVEFLCADYWEIGLRLAALSAQHARMLGLAPNALDATLIVALQYGESIRVYFFGDGCLICQYPDTDIRIIQVEYEHSAPYYLSYLEDGPRHERYLQANPAKMMHTLDATGTISETRCIDAPAIFEFSLDEINILGIASDGLKSFTAATTEYDCDITSVASELLAFKSLHGDFVKRRLRRALTTFARQGIHNNDDIALGVFAKVAP